MSAIAGSNLAIDGWISNAFHYMPEKRHVAWVSLWQQEEKEEKEKYRQEQGQQAGVECVA